MHRIIRDHLEEILTGPGSAPEHPAAEHLKVCEECRDAVEGMRRHSAMLRQWRATAPAPVPEQRPGFYARVMDRIEAQGPGSVFTVFFDSLFGRRIATASLALALLLGVYVISSEQLAEPDTSVMNAAAQAPLPANLVANLVSDLPQDFRGMDFADNSQPRMVRGAPDQDAVLVNLVTYREQ